VYSQVPFPRARDDEQLSGRTIPLALTYQTFRARVEDVKVLGIRVRGQGIRRESGETRRAESSFASIRCGTPLSMQIISAAYSSSGSGPANKVTCPKMARAVTISFDACSGIGRRRIISNTMRNLGSVINTLGFNPPGRIRLASLDCIFASRALSFNKCEHGLLMTQ
jgi:hypothetical protein